MGDDVDKAERRGAFWGGFLRVIVYPGLVMLGGSVAGYVQTLDQDEVVAEVVTETVSQVAADAAAEAAAFAAEAVAKEKLSIALVAAGVANKRAEEAEDRLARAHDQNVVVINDCLDSVDDVKKDLYILEGIVEGLHGHNRVARAAGQVDEPPPPNDTGKRAKLYQLAN